MISVNNISYQIGAEVILRDVSVAIPEGGITAIIGPNGAGKSTLINLISGQLVPSAGQISLDDMGIAAMPRDALALRLALVAQHVGVASRLRVSDLVRFGRWPHAKGRMQQKDEDVVVKALKLFSLTDLSARFLDELSGGQRQRAFLAMAYAQETDWLLLDEPLNNLDMRYARAMMQHLSSMCRHEKKSVVMVIHDINYAAVWADHVIGLRDGGVVFSGPASEECSQSNIRKLFDIDVKQLEVDQVSFFAHHG